MRTLSPLPWLSTVATTLAVPDVRGSDGHGGARADQQHVVELDTRALGGVELLDAQARRLPERGTVYRPWQLRHTC